MTIFVCSVVAYGFDLGVAHADDMSYLFYYADQHELYPWLESDDVTRRRMCEMWTNFAKTFNPTPFGETVTTAIFVYPYIQSYNNASHYDHM